MRVFRFASKRSPVFAATAVLCGLLAGCGTSRGPYSESRLQAAAAAGNPNAQFIIAARHINMSDGEQNVSGDVEKIKALAQAGNTNAQVYLGELYLYGGGGVKQDLATGASWLTKASDQGSVAAEADMAYLYGAGIGVTKDGARALTLAKAATDKGSVDGLLALGACYGNGWGVPIDKAAAIGWYRKAADRKDSTGMSRLGAVYREGDGVPVDKVTAYAWYDLAVKYAVYASDKVSALKRRDELGLVLLPAEVDEAKALAGAWQPGGDLAAMRLAMDRQGGAVSTASNSASDDSSVETGSTISSGNKVMRGKDIPVVEKNMSYLVDVNADGSYTGTFHSETLIVKEAAVKDFGQRPLYFNSTLDQLDISEAYTQKPDGTRIPVNMSAVYEQPVPGSPTTPMFDDQRQKVVVFPNVEAGDTLVVTARYTVKPLLPGLFSMSYLFDRTFAEEGVRIRISAPATMPLTTEAHGLSFKRGRDGDNNVYEWRYANPAPLVENKIALDAADRAPRFFVSSYADYDQLAKAYAEAVASKTIVTPKVQSLADEITSGVGDPRRQAALLHDWVSRHIRYVAVELGRDAIIPHDPDTVLANGYGDCKDHSALLATLLKAKGIASNIVLINLGNSYTLAKPPTFSSLNHAITYLPDFDLYTDTTAGVAPFGVLPFGEYGKPVVIATTSGQVVRRTPILRTADATITMRTTARMDAEGKVSGDSDVAGTGPFSILLRGTAIAIQSAGPEQSAKSFLQSTGYEGTGNFDFSSPFGSSGDYHVSGHFETNPHPEFFSGNSFYLPRGLGFGPQPGEDLMGPINFMDIRGAEPTPCDGGREVEEISLKLPDGRHLRTLPKNFEIKNPYLHYTSQWSMSGQTVTNRREFVSLVQQPVCIGDVRIVTAKAINDIRGDYNSALSFGN
jgi:transglutaminase-like putative cysteine protease